MTATYGHHRLTADEIAHYAGVLTFGYGTPNYVYNFEAPGLHYDDWQAITAEIGRRERVAAIEVLDTTPEIKAVLLATVSQRGARKVTGTEDYTDFFKRALEAKYNGFGTVLGPYVPEKGACGIKLQPSKAVCISYRQESYSDNSEIAIPYTITEGKPADKAVFARNVSALIRRADTHNGYAGSGATWRASVRDGFIVLYCRSSVAD